MKLAPNHWGAVQAGSGTGSSTVSINVDAEIAESRAFTERLFRSYRRYAKQALNDVLRPDWPAKAQEGEDAIKAD